MEILLKQWLDIVTVIVAIAAFAVSLASLWLSSRALRLSEKQERRRQPLLIPHLLDSHFEALADGAKLYSFSISVTNPSDSDNAIARVELFLRYYLEDETLMTVRLPVEDGIRGDEEVRGRLSVPARIGAHDTISGWVFFAVKPLVLHGRVVDGYQLALIDTHQSLAKIDISLVGEKRHAE